MTLQVEESSPFDIIQSGAWFLMYILLLYLATLPLVARLWHSPESVGGDVSQQGSSLFAVLLISVAAIWAVSLVLVSWFGILCYHPILLHVFSCLWLSGTFWSPR